MAKLLASSDHATTIGIRIRKRLFFCQPMTMAISECGLQLPPFTSRDPHLCLPPSYQQIIYNNMERWYAGGTTPAVKPAYPSWFRVLQWNVQKHLNVVLLQETLAVADFEWRVAGYPLHLLPITKGTHACVLLVWNAIPHHRVPLLGQSGGFSTGAASGKSPFLGIQ